MTSEGAGKSEEELTTLRVQLRETAEQLAVANEDLTNLAASIGIAAVFLDRANRIRRFTPACAKLFDLVASDAGRPISEILPRFADHELLPDIEKAVEELQPITREIKANAKATYQIRIQPYGVGNGGADGVFITFADISKEILRERQVRESRDRHRKIFAHVPVAMLILRENGRVVLGNEGSQKLFGLNSDQLKGKKIAELVPGIVDSLERYVLDSLEDGEAELSIKAETGREIPVIVGLSMISEEPEPIFSAVIMDISASRQTNEELREALQIANSASATKSRFLATASHDLRQPLQALALRNAALLKLIESPEEHNLLEEQERSIHEMRTMLHSLLHVSRLDSGTIEANPEDLDLDSVLSEVKSDFALVAARKGLEIEVDGGGLAVRTDHALLGQLLRNLVDNAVRYTGEGFVRLTAEADGANARLSVVDSGQGIAEDKLAEVFEEFVRGDLERSERDGGLGLGLSIVKRIAELLGTKVDVVSKLGEGTTFSLALPRADTATPSDSAPEPAIKQQSGVILHVDDDDAVRKSTRMLLSIEPGFTVLSAASAGEAYAILDDARPDVILADFHLGKGAAATGDEVIAEVRRKLGEAVPAILMTGDTSDKIDMLKGSDFEIMTKPVDGRLLVAALHRHLAKAAAGSG